jgi:hypothetical protein
MPIPMQCSCGRAMQVKDEMAGRKIRCPDCKQVLPVPAQRNENDVEDEALRILSADAPEEKKSASAEPEKTPAVQERPKPFSAPQIPKSGISAAKPAVPKPISKPKKSRSDRAGFGIAVHPSIIAGVLMMVGAAVWFFLGLAAGIIYPYAPILFLFGIGAVIRGFTGQD